MSDIFYFLPYKERSVQSSGVVMPASKLLEFNLCVAIASSADCAAAKLTSAMRGTHGVVVLRAGRPVGIWRVNEGLLKFRTPDACSDIAQVRSIAEAIKLSLGL